MKILVFIIFYFGTSSAFPEITAITATKKSVAILQQISKNDIAKEWLTKLGDRIPQIAKLSQKFGAYAGPVGDVITFALTIAGEHQNQTEEYLKHITDQLDKLDSKMDAISDQVKLLGTFISSKIEQSTNKIITEVKFRDYFQYFEDLAALKQHFESIVYSFSSNPAALVIQLDKYIEEYRQKGSDTKLINTLDSGAGLSKSIVDDLITLTRSYYRDHQGSPGSSTMKTIYDVYITAFVAVMKSNLILESAVNMKHAITGNDYEQDRRYNHYRRNEIFTKFFTSLEKTFQKLTDSDMDGFNDFTINGNNNPVRLSSVLQYYWEYEQKLDGTLNTCSKTCSYYKKSAYYGNGCYGTVRDCKFGVDLNSEERYMRQVPQIDRIYNGYVLNNKWYGNSDGDPKHMEYKRSYPRFLTRCDVCKCTCDQHQYSGTVRKIYTGKISAPMGYVVTGMRFIERSSIIYPQIQVGKLLPMTMIDQSSVKWLDVPNDQTNVTFNYDIHSIGFGDPSSLSFVNGVVTGVQFKSTSYGASWSIYGKELVDFNKGLLGNDVNADTPNSLSNFDAFDLIPGLNSGSINYSIRKNTRVKFGISNDEKDAGQSFVPYFEGTEISFDVKSPLSGITLGHYTNDNEYAGYIRPLIRSLNYRKNFDTSYQPDEFISKTK